MISMIVFAKIQKKAEKLNYLRGMSTKHKIPFIFVAYNQLSDFSQIWHPSINREMYRIKNRLVAKF